jgi:hypothetical protein
MREILSVTPRSFEKGIVSAIENWRHQGLKL